jgi:hypothetical protein
VERCIKGTVFDTVASEVRRALDAGSIPRALAEHQLERGDLELVAGAVQPGTWYPIDAHDRLLRLLLRYEGRGQLAYWIEGGRRAADALRESGIYDQLRDETAARLGDRFEISVSDAEGFPESCRYRAVGFIERAASRAMGAEIRCTSRRPSPDRIVFRASRAARGSGGSP